MTHHPERGAERIITDPDPAPDPDHELAPAVGRSRVELMNLLDATDDLATTIADTLNHARSGLCSDGTLDATRSDRHALRGIGRSLSVYAAHRAAHEAVARMLDRQARALTDRLGPDSTCSWCIDLHAQLIEAHFAYRFATEPKDTPQ